MGSTVQHSPGADQVFIRKISILKLNVTNDIYAIFNDHLEV